MKRSRFFNTAGEKRKFNLRHFGQTRNLGIAALGLLPVLGIIGLVVMCTIAVTHIHWGQTSVTAAVASKGHARGICQILAVCLGATVAFNGMAEREAAKRRMSLQQAKANFINANNKLMDVAIESGHEDLTPAEAATFEANLAQIKKINRLLGIAEQPQASSGKRPVKPEHDPGGSNVEVLEKPKFNSIGEQLQAVAIFNRTHGASRDPRLVIMGSPEHRRIMAAAGINESIPSEGGFLVQADLASDLLQRVYETGKLLPLCNRIEISSAANRCKVNLIDETSRANGSRFGGVQSFWTNEAQSVTATKPKFRQAELILNKLMAICYATDEMVRDAGVMNSVINSVFPQEFAFRIEDGIVNGLGNGQPIGFLNSGALIVVTKEGSQAANTVLAANIMKMWARLWGPSRFTAVWLIDQSIEPQLYQMTITTGSGISTPIYLPPGGLSGSPYGTLFGRPVIPIEYGAALSSQGDIILADLSQYMLAEKGQMEAASSMHVNFTTDEMAFRFIMRVDGQSQWNAPLTPKSNSGTLSPFVTLQAR
jgi:HK97 family phage major capsid protein